MKKADVVIIGGGAAGLMAAITAADTNSRVIIIEHSARVGKKILSTGNGKCNLTNKMQGTSYYRGLDPAFAVSIFEQFNMEDTCSFFENLGIMLTDKNGYIYPRCGQASSVLEALYMECERKQIKIHTECELQKITNKNSQFFVQTNQGEFIGKSMIIAVGGLAAAKLGSDGSAFRYIEAFGHKIQNMVPALVALKAKESYFKALAGIRADISLKLLVDGQVCATESGELQLTNYGVSGIPIFQVSRFAAYGLKEKKKVMVSLDFAANDTHEELFKKLQKRRLHYLDTDFTVEQVMNGFLNKKLLPVLLKLAGVSPNEKINRITDGQLRAIVKQTKEWKVSIIDTLPFENAQVTAGGVVTSQLKPTMESKLVEGLFFAGEIVDIDGICGGYNLQWAWSSGYVAGKSAAERSQND